VQPWSSSVLSITFSTNLLFYICPFFWEFMNVCVILWISCVWLCYSLTFYIILQVFVLLSVCLCYSLNIMLSFDCLCYCLNVPLFFECLCYCLKLLLFSECFFYSLSFCVIIRLFVLFSECLCYSLSIYVFL